MLAMSLRAKKQILALIAVFLLPAMLSSCKQRESKAAEKSGETAKHESAKSTEGNAGPKTFASPEAAGAALIEAAKAGDQNALMGIFGPEGKDILYSGDAVSDKNIRERFVTKYDQMHRWDKDK